MSRCHILFAHGHKRPTLSVGETIKKDARILYQGNTGISTGNHLHFTVLEKATATLEDFRSYNMDGKNAKYRNKTLTDKYLKSTIYGGLAFRKTTEYGERYAYSEAPHWAYDVRCDVNLTAPVFWTFSQVGVVKHIGTDSAYGNYAIVQFETSDTPQPEKQGTYTVKKGDTLWDIANMYGLTLGEIKELNPQIKNMNVIHVGDKVNVIVGEKKHHTVKKGENLSTIATKYGLTLKKIIALNPQIKNPDLIYSGDKIRIK